MKKETFHKAERTLERITRTEERIATLTDVLAKASKEVETGLFTIGLEDLEVVINKRTYLEVVETILKAKRNHLLALNDEFENL